MSRYTGLSTLQICPFHCMLSADMLVDHGLRSTPETLLKRIVVVGRGRGDTHTNSMRAAPAAS